jgi:hypothetical protein
MNAMVARLNGRTVLDAALRQAPDRELLELLDRLVREAVPEDTWLDYKSGEATRDLDTVELRRAWGGSRGRRVRLLLDAEVAIAARDRDRRESLLRYFLRPPLSHDRLRYLPAAGGRVILELKKPWQDGSTHVEMTPAALLGRLASLVPRPRKNTTLYFGVLAGNVRGRSEIVPEATRTPARREDHSWATLMKHSFGLDVLGCPRCPKRLRLVAVLHDRAEVRRLLQNLRMWSDPIAIRPARAPPDDLPDGFDFP